MELKNNTESIIDSVCYIVCTSTGKPNIVLVDDYDSDSIAIKPEGKSDVKPLWFSRKILFSADSDLIKKLQNAYRKGDLEELEALWGKVKPWVPPEAT